MGCVIRCYVPMIETFIASEGVPFGEEIHKGLEAHEDFETRVFRGKNSHPRHD